MDSINLNDDEMELVLVLMGRAATQLPRLYFDAEHNTVLEEAATR